MVLLVVLLMLTLFAIVALAFVLYASAEAESARVYREANMYIDFRPDVSAESAANFTLAQLLLGSPEPSFSSMRGHDLGRDIYGWNSDAPGSNIYPFNGIGRPHTDATSSLNPWGALGADDHMMINYVPFLSNASTNQLRDGFVRDPERGLVVVPGQTTGRLRTSLTDPLGVYVGGWNSSYTYPDGNHLYLAAVNGSGQVLVPSFYRPWLVPGGNLPLDPLDPNYGSWFADPNGMPAGFLDYFTLRPRNINMGPNFPRVGVDPVTGLRRPGGDVKNLVGFGNPNLNDAIWMDLGYPVQVTADGTKFIPLFAITIVDRDGCINLNSHGNIRGANNVHGSLQGWGRWEVNSSLLAPANAAEFAALFLGSPSVIGRYGPDGRPNQSGTIASAGLAPRIYSRADFDGTNDGQGGAATAKVNYPAGTVTTPSSLSFPTFPAGYTDGSALERTDHPLLYNLFNPGGDDRRFPVDDLVKMLATGNSGSDWRNSNIGKLAPTTFAQRKNRWLITTDSYGLNRASPTPWLYNRADPANTYGVQATVNNGHSAPTGPAIPFPSLVTRSDTSANGVVPAASDFIAPGQPNTLAAVDWRALDAALGKIDLSRFLSPYPHMGQGTTRATFSAVPLTNGPNDRFDGNTAAVTQFLAAQADRQKFADDIYRMFLRVTGVPPVANTSAPTAAELATRRWLAQLAVNIVDFFDEDEISTPFNFYTTADGIAAAQLGAMTAPPAGWTSAGNGNTNEMPTYWVFGTELPRVLVNEVLAEFKQTAVTLTTGTVDVRLFVELCNPLPNAAAYGGNFPTSVQPAEKLGVPLYVAATANSGPGYSPYRVVLGGNNTATSKPILDDSATLNGNNLGTPTTVRTLTSDADFSAAIPQIGGGNFDPSNSATGGLAPQQFLIVGGGADFNGTISAGRVPAGTPFLQTNSLRYAPTYAANGWSLNGNTISDQTRGVSVYLRRLANPHLPPNPNPLQANGSPDPSYNPFITVDFMENIRPNDGTTTGYSSIGKTQPYAAHNTQVAAQTSGAVPVFHSFGAKNVPGPATGRYDWPVFVDRTPISAGEVLQVSGFYPHQYTHQFMQTGASFAQRTPWFDQTTRLYRAFEFFAVKDRSSGTSPGGRIPGQINLNTIWDIEVFRALCDAQPGNQFTASDVDAMFYAMIASRSPGQPASSPVTQITGADRPFLGFGTGRLPQGDLQAKYSNATDRTGGTGIEDTFFRSTTGNGNATDPRLFEPTGFTATNPPTNPYIRHELMTKIMGSVTNRSNVFAVWVTVGFFRVLDDSVRPVKLDGEINLAQNKNIRHRFFFVVDRSKLTIAPSIGTVAAAIPQAQLQTPITITAATSGTTSTGIPWAIQAGTVLVIDPNMPTEETVVVSAVTATTFTAQFQNPHAAGFSYTIPGNPGPQPAFNASDPNNAGVIQAFTILQ
jgi:hypothetical protein